MNVEPSSEDIGRKNPASGVHIQLGGPNLVFLTVNTRQREPWLANEIAHSFLRAVWREAAAWLVGDYLLMPDHLHLFCAPRDLAFEIEDWIAYWKSQFRKRHGHAEWRWQSRGWHRRLRDDEAYSEKWLYVQENPVRRGLVKRMQDWPYSGQIHLLPWTGGK